MPRRRIGEDRRALADGSPGHYVVRHTKMAFGGVERRYFTKLFRSRFFANCLYGWPLVNQ
jgi:hypothetical protein